MNKLTGEIQRLINQANLNPGQWCSHTLEHGLKIQILQSSTDAQYKIAISRPDLPGPSLAKYQTILKHWPTPISVSDLTGIIAFKTEPA